MSSYFYKITCKFGLRKTKAEIYKAKRYIFRVEKSKAKFRVLVNKRWNGKLIMTIETNYSPRMLTSSGKKSPLKSGGYVINYCPPVPAACICI